MCNVADIMHSTADSTRSATDSMQVTADILPKSVVRLLKWHSQVDVCHLLWSSGSKTEDFSKGAQTQK